MLGYVKCDPGELLVRQHGLYRALYCGLCRSARRGFGAASSPFHSYDFVFLAAVRHLVLGEPYRIERRRCFFDHTDLSFSCIILSTLFLTYFSCR